MQFEFATEYHTSYKSKPQKNRIVQEVVNHFRYPNAVKYEF